LVSGDHVEEQVEAFLGAKRSVEVAIRFLGLLEAGEGPHGALHR
jgi:hypothetical protein